MSKARSPHANRSHYSGAWLVLILNPIWGILIPLCALWASYQINGKLPEQYFGDLLLLGISAVAGFRLAIVKFARRKSAGVGSIIGNAIALILIGVVVSVVFLVALSTRDFDTPSVFRNVMICLWAYLAVVEPLLAIFLLPKFKLRYKKGGRYIPDGNRNAGRAGTRVPAYGRSYGGTYSGTYSGYDSGYDASDKSDDSAWDDVDLPDDYSDSSYDSYIDYTDYTTDSYYFSDNDDSSYESYKESENYYTPADSYAIYESYYSD